MLRRLCEAVYRRMMGRLEKRIYALSKMVPESPVFDWVPDEQPSARFMDAFLRSETHTMILCKCGTRYIAGNALDGQERRHYESGGGGPQMVLVKGQMFLLAGKHDGQRYFAGCRCMNVEMARAERYLLENELAVREYLYEGDLGTGGPVNRVRKTNEQDRSREGN